jgi:hypothetical protein
LGGGFPPTNFLIKKEEKERLTAEFPIRSKVQTRKVVSLAILFFLAL